MTLQNNENWTVTRIQLFMLVFVLLSGATFINLQFRVINASQQHAWIVFLGVCLIHFFILWGYVRFGHYFVPSKFMLFLYRMYWGYLILVFLCKLVFVTQLWVFQETPMFVIIVLSLAVIIYALLGHPSVLLNLSVLLIPFFILLIISMFLSWKELTWLNLLPLSGLSTQATLKGAFQSLSAFNGMESLLFLQSRLAKGQQIRKKDLVLFMSIYASFLVMTIVLTLAFFSLKEIEVVPFALMYLLKSQEVTFIERIDMFFIYFWVSWSIVSIAILGFLIFRSGQYKELKIAKVFIVFLPIGILSMFLSSRFQIIQLHDYMLAMSLVFSFILPTVICMKGWWKKRVT